MMRFELIPQKSEVIITKSDQYNYLRIKTQGVMSASQGEGKRS